MKLSESFESMGLTRNIELNGYYYSDIYSSVLYADLYHLKNSEIYSKVPCYGVFCGTSGCLELSELKYTDNVSDLYSFVGNQILDNNFKTSIQDSNNETHSERHYMSTDKSEFYKEIIINNSQNIPTVGDILPMISFSNSYKGTKAANLNFGLMIFESDDSYYSFSFRQKLGRFRQIHHTGFKTTLSAAIGNYVQTFQNNISNVIQGNMNIPVQEETIFDVLSVMSKLGKKRRDSLSVFLTENKEENNLSSMWDIFKLILKFTKSERNLNVKTYVGNAVERLLVIPNGLMTFVESQEREGE